MACASIANQCLIFALVLTVAIKILIRNVCPMSIIVISCPRRAMNYEQWDNPFHTQTPELPSAVPCWDGIETCTASDTAPKEAAVQETIIAAKAAVQHWFIGLETEGNPSASALGALRVKLAQQR
jgi:hypothetical protein